MKNSEQPMHLFTWFLAEGRLDGAFALYRGREIPAPFIGEATLPELFVLVLRFEPTTEDRFPSQEQYEHLDDFEELWITPMETSESGICVFTCTTPGIVRYFCYVKEGESVKARIDSIDLDLGSLEIRIAHDPDWAEYRAFIGGLKV